MGAIIVYFCIHRADRIQDFFYSPRANWRVLLFDIVFFFLGAALVTAFILEPTSRKEAILAGASWEGVISGLLTRNPRRRLQKALGAVPRVSRPSVASSTESTR